MNVSRVAIGRLVGAAAALVVGLALVTVLAPQSTGPLALAQILLPHIFLATLLVAAWFALALRTRAMTLALIGLVVVGCLRFGTDWVSLPVQSATGTRVAFLSWNLEVGSRPPDQVAPPLLAHHADIVALQELTPGAAAALEADSGIRERYPYRVLMPDRDVFGLGILSAFPIVAQSLSVAPVSLVVELDLGSGRHMRVFDAHPLPGRIEEIASVGLPVAFDATDRDDEIARLRTRIDPLLAGNEPLVVIGDYNTTPTEPAYARLTSGLRDVHAEVGEGPGWTWRPNRFASLGIGLLRIDLVLVSPGVSPLSDGVDCGHPGDHCIVSALVAVP